MTNHVHLVVDPGNQPENLSLLRTTKRLDMREEYFFSKAERGKFYRPDARFNLPVYLDEEVQTFVQAIAEKRRTDLSMVVNQLLRGDMICR